MKAPFSEYLNGLIPYLRQVLSSLEEEFEYVSILSTDCVGLSVRSLRYSKSVGNKTMTTERGTVIRVSRNGLYSEYAITDLHPDKLEETIKNIKDELNAQIDLLLITDTPVYETALLPDEPLELFVEEETEQLPENADLGSLVDLLVSITEKGISLGEDVLECSVSAQSTHISKVFLSHNRFLRQSYVYSEGNVAVIAAKDEQNRVGYESVSGLCGPELFADLEHKLEPAYRTVQDLLRAERIVPGEYEIITSPEVTGLIAHEAFGHGVEMDMFVKNRALGKEYIGKRVGSDLVTMHEGALCAEEVASYAFDDEGTLAGDTVEIRNGILQTGVCDALSALRLGTKPTGNGKRQSFENKVYTRMTNTVFDSGTDTLDDMIASVKYGYLLEGMKSGMEDPKHWGIQCIVERGLEIRDGKLTGKVVAPIVMTGYVPDLLGSISMASTDREVFGSGACGKGHKEWVKVSDGGPYLKAKARLG